VPSVFRGSPLRQQAFPQKRCSESVCGTETVAWAGKSSEGAPGAHVCGLCRAPATPDAEHPNDRRRQDPPRGCTEHWRNMGSYGVRATRGDRLLVTGPRGVVPRAGSERSGRKDRTADRGRYRTADNGTYTTLDRPLDSPVCRTRQAVAMRARWPLVGVVLVGLLVSGASGPSPSAQGQSAERSTDRLGRSWTRALTGAGSRGVGICLRRGRVLVALRAVEPSAPRQLRSGWRFVRPSYKDYRWG
jgi:hypothetical protein